jgi:hypothetical protein
MVSGGVLTLECDVISSADKLQPDVSTHCVDLVFGLIQLIHFGTDFQAIIMWTSPDGCSAS